MLQSIASATPSVLETLRKADEDTVVKPIEALLKEPVEMGPMVKSAAKIN